MESVAAFARLGFDAVAAALPDVVRPCSLRRAVGTAYDPETGQFVSTYISTDGRAVFDTARPVESTLPGLTPGPTDKLVWLEGLEWAPQAGDVLSLTDLSPEPVFTVVQAADVAEAGGYFAAVVT